MKFLNREVAPLGLGCWPIGGEMYGEDGTSLGYSNVSDEESLRAVRAAASAGVTVFDTAAAYGAGHSERLLAKALKDVPDALIITKIGIPINEQTKQLSFGGIAAADVIPAIEQSAARLDRECVDLVLLHLNELSAENAEPLFDQMDQAVAAGKLRAYGWSTDFSVSVQSVSNRENFVAVEHAMNVLIDAPVMQSVAAQHDLHTLIRSPLAMGLLSGKYNAASTLGPNDIRGTDQGWLQYFNNGKPNAVFLERLNAVQELLRTGGRSTVQGALCWLWSKNEKCIPIPGARTVEQVESLTQALSFGPLPPSVMSEIEALIDRSSDVDEQERAR